MRAHARISTRLANRLTTELLDVALSPSNAFNAKVFEDIARSLPVQERECILAWAMHENANVPKTLQIQVNPLVEGYRVAVATGLPVAGHARLH